MTSDDPVVMPFPHAELPENPLKLTPNTRLFYCSHPSIIVDEYSRTVQCAEPRCGAMLDAFEYLRTNARTLLAGHILKTGPFRNNVWN